MHCKLRCFTFCFTIACCAGLTGSIINKNDTFEQKGIRLKHTVAVLKKYKIIKCPFSQLQKYRGDSNFVNTARPAKYVTYTYIQMYSIPPLSHSLLTSE